MVLVSMGFHFSHKSLFAGLVGYIYTYKYISVFTRIQPIVKLGDVVTLYYLGAKGQKCSRSLGHFYGKQRFFARTYKVALGYLLQSLKCYVRARTDCNNLGIFWQFVLLNAGYRQCPGRFYDATCVLEERFYGSANLIRVHGYNLVHMFLGDLERKLTNLFDGHAISKYSHMIKGNAFACLERGLHRVTVFWLYTDDAYIGTNTFNELRD